MKRVIFEFPDEASAKRFLVQFCDGNGEQNWFVLEDLAVEDGLPEEQAIRRFDYSRAFPEWGYDPAKHGTDLVVKAMHEGPAP